MTGSRQPTPITIAGHDATTAPDAPAPADPREVRATVAPSTRLEGDPTLAIAPAPDPADALPGDPVAPCCPTVNGVPIAASLEHHDPVRAVLTVDGARTDLLLGAVRHDTQRGVAIREVVVDGWRFEIEIEPERRAVLRERARRGAAAGGHGGPVEVRAIIPGRVVAVLVAAGDTVEAGQRILVVEAMKMQNELRAPREGTVDRVGVAVGDTLDVGDLLVVIH